MGYGVAIYNERGQDVISGLVAEFAVESIIPSGNGSKSYTLNSGEQLRATRFLTFKYNPSSYNTILDTVTVSGNTVSWVTRTDPYLENPLSDAILVTKVVT